MPRVYNTICSEEIKCNINNDNGDDDNKNTMPHVMVPFETKKFDVILMILMIAIMLKTQCFML